MNVIIWIGQYTIYQRLYELVGGKGSYVIGKSEHVWRSQNRPDKFGCIFLYKMFNVLKLQTQPKTLLHMFYKIVLYSFGTY